MAKFGDFLKSQASSFVDQGVNRLLGNVFGGSREPADGFSVNRMVSSLNKSGIAKTSHYEVFVFGGGNGDTERDMAFRVDSIDIPGRNFIPTDHKFTNIGPSNKVPTQQTYVDIAASIILSEDMREKEYFEAWQERVMNTGAYEGNGAAAFNAAEEQAVTEANENLVEYSPKKKYNPNYVASPFGFKYFKDYIGRVEIRQYGSGGEIRSIHTLNEAYPLSIAPIGMNWSEDNPARLMVTFAYRNYKAFFYKQNQPSLGGGFSFSLGKGGLAFGGSIPGLGNVSFAKGAGISGNFQPLQKTIFKNIGL